MHKMLTLAFLTVLLLSCVSKSDQKEIPYKRDIKEMARVDSLMHQSVLPMIGESSSLARAKLQKWTCEKKDYSELKGDSVVNFYDAVFPGTGMRGFTALQLHKGKVIAFWW